MSGTGVLQITEDIPFPCNFLALILCNTDNKHEFSKTVSIHNDVGNAHLLLCTTHNNSLITPVISFPPTVNDTVFQISNTAEEADQKII